MSRFRAKHSEYDMSNVPVTLETRQEKSSEVSIPVLEHGKLHFGSGRVSVLNIMIKIAISPGASLGTYPPSEMETHQDTSSEVIIPVLEHG